MQQESIKLFPRSAEVTLSPLQPTRRTPTNPQFQPNRASVTFDPKPALPQLSRCAQPTRTSPSVLRASLTPHKCPGCRRIPLGKAESRQPPAPPVLPTQ